jgi:hypothetical protein
MGDPTEQGEDQEATIIIEGPPASASKSAKAEFDSDFKDFKAEVKKAYAKYPRLKVRLKRLHYVKKDKT